MSERNHEKPSFVFRDLSAGVFGKYQYCSKGPNTDGLWYADADLGLDGRPRRGALPNPRQDTAEDVARATAMHEASAKALMDSIFKPDCSVPATDATIRDDAMIGALVAVLCAFLFAAILVRIWLQFP